MCNNKIIRPEWVPAAYKQIEATFTPVAVIKAEKNGFAKRKLSGFDRSFVLRRKK